LEENDTYSNIVRARPSCILALDNEYLSHEMVLNLNSNLIITINIIYHTNLITLF